MKIETYGAVIDITKSVMLGAEILKIDVAAFAREGAKIEDQQLKMLDYLREFRDQLREGVSA